MAIDRSADELASLVFHPWHRPTQAQKDSMAATFTQVLRRKAPEVPSPPPSDDEEGQGGARRSRRRLTPPPDPHPPREQPRKDDPEGGGGSGGPSRSPGQQGTVQVTQASQAGEKSISPPDQTTKGGTQERSHRAQSVGTSFSPDTFPVSLPPEGGQLMVVPSAKPQVQEVPAYMAWAPALLSSPLELLEPEVRTYLAQHLKRIPAHRGNRQVERVRAPIIQTGAKQVWVNGTPLRGSAIWDTGAMPLLIGRPGMVQLGLRVEDTIPNAVRLALADGKSTQLFGVTKNPIQFTFNPGEPSATTIAVRAVVTQAPYDFLLGNVILLVIGGIIGGWREQFRYQVNWQAGPYCMDGPEGFIPLTYEREPEPRTELALYTMRPHQGGGDGWALAGADGSGESEWDSENNSEIAQDDISGDNPPGDEAG